MTRAVPLGIDAKSPNVGGCTRGGSLMGKTVLASISDCLVLVVDASDARLAVFCSAVWLVPGEDASQVRSGQVRVRDKGQGTWMSEQPKDTSQYFARSPVADAPTNLRTTSRQRRRRGRCNHR